ncbi:MAG TPA: hypothetical protein VFA18_15320, partial [Gemmataceae bacterium]|nr:hypothetical protein [Gemmataceae bacterium]
LRAIHDLKPKLPSGADTKPARVALLATWLQKAQPKKSYNAKDSYVICQDIVDLYGQNTDPDVKKLAAAALKLRNQRAKELKLSPAPDKH